MYYGQMYTYSYHNKFHFFTILRGDKNWPWFTIYDNSRMNSKYVDDDLRHLTHAMVNDIYIGDTVSQKPLRFESWQPLCAAVDAKNGRITIVRLVSVIHACGVYSKEFTLSWQIFDTSNVFKLRMSCVKLRLVSKNISREKSSITISK